MSEFKFNYRPEASHRANFIEWRTLNSEERSAYNEKQYTEAEAREVFEKMYGKGDLSVDN
jgi:hypothetical protein